MPKTEQDPAVEGLITVADWALRCVYDTHRRERICRHMSGWFARRAVTEAESRDQPAPEPAPNDEALENRVTPLRPPSPDIDFDIAIPVTEGSSYPPSEPDD